MGREVHFKIWPARYKSLQIEVFESERYQNWLTVNDVRKAVPSLRKDASLQKDYPTGIEQIDKSKRLFFNETSLFEELKRNRSQDALMFLVWFEKTVVYSARRKREGLPVLPTAQAKPSYDENGKEVVPDDSDKLHIPKRKPMEAIKPKRDALTIPIAKEPTAPGISAWLLRPFVQIWRGQMDLKATFFGGGMIALVFAYCVDSFIGAVGNTENYQGDYIYRQWVIAMAVFVSAIGPIWWCVGLMRCGLRYQREQRNVPVALFAFVAGATVVLNSTASTLSTGGEWLHGWFDDVTNTRAVVEVLHDPILGRMVLRGEIGFGSYKALKQALSIKPKLSLIQVESPGGYVIEGMAMAKLIEDSGLDTVVMEKCASACTLLLAAGNERYLGPSARVGFHRSGVFGQLPSTGWTDTEYKIAEYYRARGTSYNFVKHALDTPFNRIWVPEHGLMLEAGYASKLWSERKKGY